MFTSTAFFVGLLDDLGVSIAERKVFALLRKASAIFSSIVCVGVGMFNSGDWVLS